MLVWSRYFFVLMIPCYARYIRIYLPLREGKGRVSRFYYLNDNVVKASIFIKRFKISDLCIIIEQCKLTSLGIAFTRASEDSCSSGRYMYLEQTMMRQLSPFGIQGLLLTLNQVLPSELTTSTLL